MTAGPDYLNIKAFMTRLEHKIPPPAILAVCAALAWLIADHVANPLAMSTGANRLSAVALTLIAFGMAFSALFEFRRARTTVDPHQPDKASALVDGGVFRYSRNPMYLSLLLLLLAWVVYLGNVVGIVVLPILVLYLNRYQIRPEEKILAVKFGDAYTDYCRRVRRWI